MATTIDVRSYQDYVGSRHPTPQALISSARKALFYVLKLTFDARYSTGGYRDVDLKQYGAKSIQFVLFGNSNIGATPYYDDATGAIQFTDNAGSELANNSAQPNAKTIEVLVFART